MYIGEKAVKLYVLVVIVTEEYQREVSDSAAGLALDCRAGGREGLKILN